MRGNERKQRENHLSGKNIRERNIIYVCYGVLALLSLGFCTLFVLRFGVFGSNVDWVNQHSVFPDYFRKRFYATGDLLPDFAWNLGAGQNIYTISYYGLFNPVILLSYLFPFVRMDIYIMISSIMSYVAAVLLMFYWLYRHHYPRSLSLGVTILFSLSTAFIYHSYHQIMFVDYMPYLCLALIGTDRFLRKNKRGLLVFSVWGMILTSFYFSISSIFVLCLYALSEYLQQDGVWDECTANIETSSGKTKIHFCGFDWKKLFSTAIRYLGQILLAILMSGILLVPTVQVIFGDQRIQTIDTGTVLEFFSFEPRKLLYSPYGTGMSMIIIVAVLGGIIYKKKWTERVLPVSIFLIFTLPIVGFLLNGGLYDRGKVFIPFLPLLMLQCSRFIQENIQQKWSYRKILLWLFSVLSLIMIWQDQSYEEYHAIAMLDLMTVALCLWIARRWKKPGVAVLSAILCLFMIQLGMNPKSNHILSRTEYSALHNEQIEEQVQQIEKADTDLYRMEVFSDDQTNHNNINCIINMGQYITSLYSSCSNAEYANFRKHIFHINEPLRNNMMQSVTDNPCFLQFMGVKYRIIGRGKEDGGYSVLKNEQAAPIWYVTDQVISESDYESYTFPNCQTALLQKSVVPLQELAETSGQEIPDSTNSFPTMVQSDFTIPEMETEDLSIRQKEEGTYQILAKEAVTISVPIEGQNENQDLLAVSFGVKNLSYNRDICICINDQTNQLSANYTYANHNDTFYYMMNYVRNQNIEITFSKGEYEISNWKAYIGCLAALQNQELYQYPVQTDPDSPEGDCLSGRVTNETDGYLITSIPYDENFMVTIDGEVVDSIRVNTSFLGAKLDAGNHEIRIEYHAPGKKVGVMMSIVGIVLLAVGGFGRHCWQSRMFRKTKQSDSRKK